MAGNGEKKEQLIVPPAEIVKPERKLRYVQRNFMVPTHLFLVKGVGTHKEQLASFELALRDAGIMKYNLVYVSSIFPPKCKRIPSAEGLMYLKDGQALLTVMARATTNEPNRLVAASIGVAQAADENQYGYLSEHHNHGETDEAAGDYAEDLAATMLATTLGIEFDPEAAWNEREEVYKSSGQIFRTSNITQSAVGPKSGQHVTVIAAAVMVELEEILES